METKVCSDSRVDRRLYKGLSRLSRLPHSWFVNQTSREHADCACGHQLGYNVFSVKVESLQTPELRRGGTGGQNYTPSV